MYYLAITTSCGGPGDGDYLVGTLLEGAFFMASNKQVVPAQKHKARPIWGNA